LALVAVASLAFAPAAHAGGWWNTVDPGAALWAPGLHVRADSDQSLFPSIEAAERAFERGEYYAYLLEGFDYEIVDRALGEAFDPEWWRLGGATATRLGPVNLREPNGNLVHATARFEVPDVAPGRYHLMFCTEGCTRPFADAIPATLTVIRDPVVADLSRRVEQLRARADRTESSLRSKVWRLGRRVDRLAKAMDERQAATSAEPPTASRGSSGRSSAGVPVLLGALLVAGVAAILAVRRRHGAGDA
jgi:hypothetical protein